MKKYGYLLLMTLLIPIVSYAHGHGNAGTGDYGGYNHPQRPIEHEGHHGDGGWHRGGHGEEHRHWPHEDRGNRFPKPVYFPTRIEYPTRYPTDNRVLLMTYNGMIIESFDSFYDCEFNRPILESIYNVQLMCVQEY